MDSKLDSRCILVLFAAAGLVFACKVDPGATNPAVGAGAPAAGAAGVWAGTSAPAGAGATPTGAAGSAAAGRSASAGAGSGVAGTGSPTAGASAGQPSTAPDAGTTMEPSTSGAGGMSTAMPMGGGPATGDPAAPKPSPGCMGGTIQAGHTNETIQVGGARRQYVQTVPSTYDGKTPFKVLLDFHGGTYDGPRWDSRASNEFPEMAETERFIYITPTGLNAWWTTTEGKEGADGQFMTALLEKLKTTACVDERRIYATGCSMGGDMSFYMACYFSDQIAAVLPLCGSASFDLDAACKPSRPISVNFVIGSQDTLNCWEPPRTSVGNPCSTEVQATFKRLNNCTGEPKKTFDGVCETLDQCSEGVEVTICMVEAQHTTIYQNPDIDIYEDGWKYLSRYYIH